MQRGEENIQEYKEMRLEAKIDVANVKSRGQFHRD